MLFGRPKKQTAPSLEANPVSEITIVTMPEAFLPTRVGSVSSKKVGAAIMGLGLVILVGAGGWFLLNTYFTGPQLPATPSPISSPSAQPESVPLTTPESPIDFGSPSLAQTLRGEVLDAAGSTVSSARLLIGEAALSVVRELQLVGTLPPEAERETSIGLIVSGQYEIQPREIAFSQPVRLIIEYGSEVAATFPELELRGAIFDGGTWKILPEIVPDPDTDSVGFTIEGVPAQAYALIKPAATQSSLEPPEASDEARVLGSGPDTDRDGLTDEEERVYGSDPTRPDSDADSFPDGLELVNLYNPTLPPPARLATSSLITVYNNPSFGYALFAPSGFLVRATDQTNRDVLFTSTTGEFIEVSVHENSERVNTETWFRRQFPDEPIGRLRQWSVNGTTAIWSADGTNLYLAYQDKLFVLSYNVGGLERLNFKSTFEMMARSFRPQGAGIAPPAEREIESTPTPSEENNGGAPPAVP